MRAAPPGVWCIVLAAGGGSRFGARKQFLTLHGQRLVDRVVTIAAEVCDGVVAVLPGDALSEPPPSATLAVRGGATRSASVRHGLAAVPAQARIVVVADAAHPLAGPATYRAVIAAVEAGAAGAVPILPLTEALKRVDGGTITASLGREGLGLAQMPQAFRVDALRAAHAGTVEALEDSALVAALGEPVASVPGDPANLHVTTPQELVLAHRLDALPAAGVTADGAQH